jgi:hypothetical protein
MKVNPWQLHIPVIINVVAPIVKKINYNIVIGPIRKIKGNIFCKSLCKIAITF